MCTRVPNLAKQTQCCRHSFIYVLFQNYVELDSTTMYIHYDELNREINVELYDAVIGILYVVPFFLVGRRRAVRRDQSRLLSYR